MQSRRTAFREALPGLVSHLEQGRGVHIVQIYASAESELPQLIDSEPDPTAPRQLKWKHELRWELETLVQAGQVHRRKDLGRGMYSVP